VRGGRDVAAAVELVGDAAQLRSDVARGVDEVAAAEVPET